MFYLLKGDYIPKAYISRLPIPRQVGATVFRHSNSNVETRPKSRKTEFRSGVTHVHLASTVHAKALIGDCWAEAP